MDRKDHVNGCVDYNHKHKHRTHTHITHIVSINVPLEVHVLSLRAAVQADPVTDPVAGSRARDDRRLPGSLDRRPRCLLPRVCGGDDADRLELIGDEDGGGAPDVQHLTPEEIRRHSQLETQLPRLQSVHQGLRRVLSHLVG